MSDQPPAPAPSFETRPAGQEDAAPIALILRDSPEAATWSEYSVSQSLNEYGVRALVAQSRTAVSGVIFGRAIQDQAEILNLAVRSNLRRHGIGRALVTHLLTDWQQHGVRRVFLEVRESNTGALTFYHHLGFLESGRRTGYYQSPLEDARILERRLF